MAVTSSHVNLFSPQYQILSNRDMIDQEHKNVYENETKFGLGIPPVSRKRLHEAVDQTTQFVENETMQIYQQQQLEIDQFIDHHTEKVKLEIESARITNSMRLMIAAEEQISKKLRSKDNEIIKISKLNYVLQEKVKSLIVENQIWKQMAETNETAANILRCNLQRLLTDIQQQQQQRQQQQQQNENDDVESCCGSSNEGNNKVNSYSRNNECKNCGKKEACVLLLPCRHLCICSVCEFEISFCPICKSLKNATLHVNMS